MTGTIAPAVSAWVISAGAALWVLTILAALIGPPPRRPVSPLPAVAGAAVCAAAAAVLMSYGQRSACWPALAATLMLHAAMWCVRSHDDRGDDPSDDPDRSGPDGPDGEKVDWQAFQREIDRWQPAKKVFPPGGAPDALPL